MRHDSAAPALSPLNLPRPLTVTADTGGAPAAVELEGRALAVTEVLDSWRIDDEWWREEISRRYYHLLLADGRTLTVFTDLIAGGWYAQRYGMAAHAASTHPQDPSARAEGARVQSAA